MTGLSFFVDKRIYDNGLLADVFAGANLSIKRGYNLGLCAIGRALASTDNEDSVFVSSIDDKPAISLYQRYLDIVPDEYFFDNACSFPLLAPEGNRLVARVPLDYTTDGKLQFSMELEKGTLVRLSYTKPEYMISESLTSDNEMALFAPEALMLFVCLNRRVYLGNNDADRELFYHRSACPNIVWSYGYEEILKGREDGNIFNSTIVAVSMREGARNTTESRDVTDPTLIRPTCSISLDDRLVTFLEATTAEFMVTIAELEHLAERDQLTDVFNRKRMDELIRYELTKRHHANDIVLIMLDVDFFKRINDTFGYEVGDQVLKEITQYVASTIRVSDTLGRWDGEEFGLPAHGHPAVRRTQGRRTHPTHRQAKAL